MKDAKIHNNDYYQVNWWMRSILDLKGTELQVYAIIYGFTRNPQAGTFYGNLDYLSMWTGCERHAISRALSNLTAAKLLKQVEYFSSQNGQCKRHSSYVADLNYLKELHIEII